MEIVENAIGFCLRDFLRQIQSPPASSELATRNRCKKWIEAPSDQRKYILMSRVDLWSRFTQKYGRSWTASWGVVALILKIITDDGGGGSRGGRVGVGELGSSETIHRSLPESFKASLDGWETIPIEEVPHVMLTKEQYDAQYRKAPVLDTFMHFATSMEDTLQNSGGTNDQMSRYFKLFLNTVIENIVTYINEQLASRGIRKKNALELRKKFVLQRASTRYIVSTELL